MDACYHGCHMDTIRELIKTVHRLRSPGGCPWDREQTHLSLRPYLIEEAYEVLDVLDRIDEDDSIELTNALKEELGDLWLQVLLHSEIAKERALFDIDDVARSLTNKLVRRHPHVFDGNAVGDADDALASWEKQKLAEKKETHLSSVLDGLPNSLPALQKAFRAIEKVSRVGFQWRDLRGPLAKVQEEYEELKSEIESGESKEKMELELGDLLFTICNLAFFLKIQPENALRKSLDKFCFRFRHIETALKDQGKTPEESCLEEMDALWDQAKALEKD